MASETKKKDSASKDFFGMEANYSSLCNGKLHDGRQVIRPEDLMDADTSVRLKHINEKNRDVVKRIAVRTGGSVTYRVVNIEAQSYEDRMMALRSLIYEVGEYDRQMRRLKHRNKDAKEGKFLTGIRDDDTLEPVVTVMVNLSGSPWTSPRKLSELFAIDDPEMLRYVNDYEMVIVDPYAMTQEELERYTGEVKTLFSLLAFKDDMEAHSKYIMSLKDEEDVISDEAWRMLEEYAGFTEMDRSKAENEEGKVVVSRAIEQRVQLAVEAAVVKTRKEEQAKQKKMQDDMNILRSALHEMLIDKSVSKSTLAGYMGVSTDEVDSLLCDSGSPYNPE